ncbi:hypothetical protein ALP8811_02161 [Aliiroseovarius pelagivivens]|uniref:Uncharacterized protein n=1 Tax=Aliiroseovarius pelagivivens TaxID=1639690 RepID=A0A2R8AM78_9RHOB|nr:hypothetical protein [Aliiroseovarius pelagivivens]SPF77138.1 hypothetical protein ALP8811_02161 [Aliiroseovarius pelagivivens]
MCNDSVGLRETTGGPMNGKIVIRLLLALTILVSVFLRPPGTMLVLDGDTITYEICSGSDMEPVTIALDGDTQEEIDLGCDFFAAQIGALLATTPYSVPTDAKATRVVSLPHAHRFIGQTTKTSNAPRAPPLVS